MDSKLRCVFEMPNENDKMVSKNKLIPPPGGDLNLKTSKNLFLDFLSFFFWCLRSLCNINK